MLAILKGHATNTRIPVLVTLCVTNRCNLRCAYCYEEYYDRNHKAFTLEEIISLINELYEMGTKYISVSGGEALLRGDIEAIIDKINEKNMLCQFTTNGLLVKENINVLKKVDGLCVSIDGYEETNDLNRGKGSYNKIIEGMECLKENNIKFHTNTVVTKNNLNSVDEIMGLALKYDFKAQFSLLRSEESPNKEINLNDDEIKNVLRRIIDYQKRGFPIFFSQASYEGALKWPLSYDTQMVFNELLPGKQLKPCYLTKFACHIEGNGLVYPCVTLVNKIKALNFKEVGFKKAWDYMERCSCSDCYVICHHDLKRIFGLKPVVLWNAFTIVLDRIKHYAK